LPQHEQKLLTEVYLLDLVSGVIIPLCKREGVKKSGMPVGQEYLQSFTIAVLLKVEVIRLCK